jgi:hypothetical protein
VSFTQSVVVGAAFNAGVLPSGTRAQWLSAIGNASNWTITTLSTGRVALPSGTLAVTASNAPPTLASLPGVVLAGLAAATNVILEAADTDTAPTGLVFTAVSSHPSLIPASNLVLSGTGYVRSLTVAIPPSLSGTALVSVTVSDGLASAVQTFPVTADRPPELTLLGASPVTLAWGATFTDPGATAVDDFDGNLSGAASVSGTVDPSRLGTQSIYYAVTDSRGSTASAVRLVVVELADPAGDTDGDGVGDLVEYAVGGAPGAPDLVRLPVPALAGNALSFDFLARTNDPALWVGIERSADLAQAGGWTTNGVAVAVAPDQGGVPAGFERRRVVFDATGQLQQFFRLRVGR